MPPPPLLEYAFEALDQAGDLIRTRRPTVITAKGDRDSVTDVDVAVERRVRDHLAGRTPDIDFLGEEEGHAGPNRGTSRCWTLDPIDGTLNYAAGSPLCAVALALVWSGTFQKLVAVASFFLAANYCGSCLALIVLRRREPLQERPFRAWGYPWSVGIVLAGAAAPVGALLGGVLGDGIGLRATLAVGGLGVALAGLWIVLSPVRGMHESPAPLSEPGDW